MNTHEKKKDKVCIVGMYTQTRDLAPFGDDSFEIWGMNDLYSFVPRVDVLFQVHSRIKIEEFPRDPNYLDWLQKNKKIPVYMQKKYGDIPMSIPYPLQDIVNAYGDYFTNGVSYLLALAIEMKFKEIHIYGIEMEHASEHIYQKPSVTYFIGLARGKGIKIYLPKESTLMRSQCLYGFEGEDKRTRTITEKLAYYQRKVVEAQEEYEAAEKKKERMIGKVEAFNEMRTL